MPAPVAATLLKLSEPPSTVTVPVKVLVPVSTRAPGPALTRLTALAPLLTIPAETVTAPVEYCCRMRSYAPAAVPVVIVPVPETA